MVLGFCKVYSKVLFFIRLRPNVRDCGDVLLYYYLRCCLDVIAIFIFAQTNYRIPREEVEVYKLLGDHEHIVKHFGGTFRGSEGKASIFMEKCGMLFFEWWWLTETFFLS